MTRLRQHICLFLILIPEWWGRAPRLNIADAVRPKRLYNNGSVVLRCVSGCLITHVRQSDNGCSVV